MKRILNLGYHYVRDGKAPGLNCKPERFRSQLEWLLRNGYEILTCVEVVSKLHRGNLPKKYATLSFDDGLEDHYKTVLPILKEFGVPATFFFITCTLENKLPPVIGFQILINQLGAQRLEKEILPEVFKKTPYLDLLDPVRYDANSRKIGEPEEMRRIKWMFNHWPSQSFKRDRIDEMFSKYLGEGSQKRFARKWFMTSDELLKMQQAGMEIASHSHTHPPFDVSGLTEILWEVKESKKILSAVLKSPIETFAWPFGGQFRQEVQKLIAGYFNSAWNFCSDLKELPNDLYQNLFDIPRLSEGIFLPEVN